MNLKIVFIVSILCLAAFLRLYQLPETMMFIGDQAWFYLSAKDMLLQGNIPLVGIASSHPWLHQGAFWTYILVPIFAVFQFNPLSPGYFVAGLGLITTYLMYSLGSKMFSRRVGLLAAVLYATSPLIVFLDRMPYHTSPIALLTLVFVYSMYKWILGNVYYFVASIFLLATLYNFQISTTPLLAVLMVFVVYGFWKKQKYFTHLLNKKILLVSFLAWFVPMLPMLLYDISHGFPQTVKFIIWAGYKVALLFGFPNIHGDRVFAEVVPFWSFTITEFQRMIFLPNSVIAIGILILSIGYLAYSVYISFKKRKYLHAHSLLLLACMIPLLSYFVIKTPSNAYFPMFFPTSMLAIAITIDALLAKNRYKILGYAILFMLICLNSYTFVKSNFLMGENGYGLTFHERLDTSKEIVKKTSGMRYNIVGKGPGSQFESFTMNYAYLTWWLGYGSSDKPEKLKIFIEE